MKTAGRQMDGFNSALPQSLRKTVDSVSDLHWERGSPKPWVDSLWLAKPGALLWTVMIILMTAVRPQHWPQLNASVFTAKKSEMLISVVHWIPAVNHFNLFQSSFDLKVLSYQLLPSHISISIHCINIYRWVHTSKSANHWKWIHHQKKNILITRNDWFNWNVVHHLDPRIDHLHTCTAHTCTLILMSESPSYDLLSWAVYPPEGRWWNINLIHLIVKLIPSWCHQQQSVILNTIWCNQFVVDTLESNQINV